MPELPGQREREQRERERRGSQGKSLSAETSLFRADFRAKSIQNVSLGSTSFPRDVEKCPAKLALKMALYDQCPFTSLAGLEIRWVACGHVTRDGAPGL